MQKPPTPKPLPNTPTPASYLSSYASESATPLPRNLSALRNSPKASAPSLLGGA